MPSPIRSGDIYRIRQPLDLRLSPDGTRAVVCVSQPDQEQLKNLIHLWLVDLRAAGATQAFQFTQGKHSESNPRWSPDGTRIGFLSERSGKSEFWVIPAGGGEARQVTQLKGTVSDFAWHPDGRTVVVVFTPQDDEAKKREEQKKRGEPGADAPAVREIQRLFYKLDGSGFLPQGKAHLWRVDLKRGRARRLTRDERFSEEVPRLSPDGRVLYFLSNRSADPDRDLQRMDLWRMPSGGGRLTKIRKFAGPAHDFALSPGGDRIAFYGRPDPDAPWNSRHTKLWLIPAAGGRPVELTAALDRSCVNTTINDTFGIPPTPPPQWSADSKWLAFAVANEGRSEVWRVGSSGGKPVPLLSLPGVVLDFAVDFTRNLIHATWADSTNPGEVRTFSFAGEPAASIPRSAFNTPWLSRRAWARPHELWCRSRDRHPVQGWVLLPPGLRKGQKCPGILYIHGGPATQYGHAFFHEFQLLAARGYAVMYSNPRASSGYSEQHLAACIGKWGTLDYADLMAFTDAALQAHPAIDRRRLGVAGGSYGGFMTNWVVGHTHRFRAAVSSRSISNFLSFVGCSDFGYAWPKGFFGHPSAWSDPRRYLRLSPLAYLNFMRTPMLIEHQEEDQRCPMEQAEQLWAALKWKGVPVEFVRYPQEPHGMSRSGRPDRRIHRLERILKWFERWLKGASEN